MTFRTARLAFILLAVAVPSTAQNDVYDNGAIDGQDYAWVINFGFANSDSFTFTNGNNCGSYGWGPCSVNGLIFEGWLYPGDLLQSVEVSITSSEFGGTTYLDQIVSFAQSACFLNNSQYGSYDVCTETGSFPDLYLNSGTYWLTLQNAQVNDGDPVFWDQNAGPSLASNSSVGTIPSESFTILGSTTTTPCYSCITMPEPSGSMLVASGLLGLLLTGSRKYL